MPLFVFNADFNQISSVLAKCRKWQEIHGFRLQDESDFSNGLDLPVYVSHLFKAGKDEQDTVGPCGISA